MYVCTTNNTCIRTYITYICTYVLCMRGYVHVKCTYIWVHIHTYTCTCMYECRHPINLFLILLFFFFAGILRLPFLTCCLLFCVSPVASFLAVVFLLLLLLTHFLNFVLRVSMCAVCLSLSLLLSLCMCVCLFMIFLLRSLIFAARQRWLCWRRQRQRLR